MSVFRFKQFSVTQSRSPFKVGTDSVLLGSWICREAVSTILDAGTGTGLLALMMAQRFPAADIHAIDIQPGAIEDAADNFRNSPWQEQLHLHAGDMMNFTFPGQFDLVVSNPPYFAGDLNSSETGKNRARHQQTFSYSDFFCRCATLIHHEGRVACIFPSRYLEDIQKELPAAGLHISRHTRIRSYSHTSFIREMVECTRMPVETPDITSMEIYRSERIYSEAYRELTRDFYLAF